MTVTNISDFRANAKQYIETVINGANAVIINRGNTAAVLISLEEYNSIKATERMISLPKISSELETSINNLQIGNTIEVNIDEL